MHDDLPPQDPASATTENQDPARPHVALLVLVLSAAASIALCSAAILTPAPPGIVPLVAAVCVGFPIFAAWPAPQALAAARARRSRRCGRSALASLRRGLEQLPETEHPLGL